MPRHPKLQGIVPERTVATCAFLVLPNDYMSLPLNKIARIIDEGPENNVHFFARGDIAQANPSSESAGGGNNWLKVTRSAMVPGARPSQLSQVLHGHTADGASWRHPRERGWV
jgi:hypothetical protein